MKRNGSSLSRAGSPNAWLLAALAAATASAAIAAGCSGDEAVTAPSTTAASTTGAGGAGATSTTTSAGGATATTTTSAGGAGGATTTTTVGGTGGAGGDGGAGGAGGAWPTCDAQPANVPSRSIHQIWTSNPAQPTEAWLPGVFVTAVSQGGCQAGAPCQIFVQQKESFANLAAGAQQALKLFVSKNAAQYFTTVKVGDQLDVLAWGVRDAMTNELLLEVTLQYEGCAKTVGTGAPVPVAADLDDLTTDAYENTLGPLFVQVSSVSGKPQSPTEIFALWKTGVFSDAGIEAIVNLSPYFLQGGAFSGLAQGKTHQFTSIAGVFGLVPEGMPAVKYKVLYPRTMADVVVGQVLP